MRLSLMLLFATVVVTYVVSCEATVESDQAKFSMTASPDLVRSLENDDTAGRRFLREHNHNKYQEESEPEERGGGIPGVSGLKNLVESSKEASRRSKVRSAAEAALKDSGKFDDMYAKYGEKYTLTQLRKYLDIDNDKKFANIYNSIVFKREIQ
ncbi:hypothetical protein PHYBOEH_005411 [Phytophthora boehmeriae]|uniref:RxLR effector protein n=1 Tax=Phytophthora boehmeriae TaxID=109152 RepID=A0A8T1WP49_9STRA|nr:hypothetical protein PHYBOEH_005411 [Phytophthora boehmeriae]